MWPEALRTCFSVWRVVVVGHIKKRSRPCVLRFRFSVRLWFSLSEGIFSLPFKDRDYPESDLKGDGGDVRPCDPETRKIKPSVWIKHGRECLTVSRFKAALFRRALRSASLGSALSRLPDSRTIFAGCEHVELTAFFFFFFPPSSFLFPFSLLIFSIFRYSFHVLVYSFVFILGWCISCRTMILDLSSTLNLTLLENKNTVAHVTLRPLTHVHSSSPIFLCL